jgi:hypothetical protein
MDKLLEQIAFKKTELDRRWRQAPGALANLQQISASGRAS